jgi:hypothetical protein
MATNLLTTEQLIACAGLYLAVALPATFIVTRYSGRFWACGLFAAVFAIFLSMMINPYLPFNYWVYVNQYMIELFVQKHLFSRPKSALFSLTIHVFAPMLFAFIAMKRWPPKERFHDAL